MNQSTFGAKLWSLCHVLRDDGIVYHKYLSELTYLLFLKIAAETNTERTLPLGCRWEDLRAHGASGLLSFYRKMLTELGEDAADQTVREIFAFPTTVFSHDENLDKVVRAIDSLDWHVARQDGFGKIYEYLLERNAIEARAGAGQYFTPRALVDCLIRLLKPSLGELIQDPAAGTGGFLVAASQYINGSRSTSKKLRFEGAEIERDTYRLCLMNMFLHGMTGKIINGDALTSDAKGLSQPDLILANPPFGSSSGGARPRRAQLEIATTNKQLLFLQHIYHSLRPGGRAAVVLPDNALFEEGAGKRVREELMRICDLHTILRLPTGIFYATGVNTNVLIFTKCGGTANIKPTRRVWFYDLRANSPKFNRGHPIEEKSFAGFEKSFGSDPYGRQRRIPSDRFKCFTRAEIASRGDNLDVSWLKDVGAAASEEDLEGLLANIVDCLTSALEEVSTLDYEMDRASKARGDE